MLLAIIWEIFCLFVFVLTLHPVYLEFFFFMGVVFNRNIHNIIFLAKAILIVVRNAQVG